ncbi:MAG: MASE3 domain-containing protein [Candidatus Methanoperedens sp.]
MGTYKKTAHILNLLTIVASIFFIGYLLESYNTELLGTFYGILFELFPVFVSFSIFGMTWFAYGKHRDNHNLFMGAAFLVIGLLNLFHMFSYPFMPGFSPEKAAIFYSAASIVSALFFLANAYVYKDTLPGLISRPVLFISAAILSYLFLVWGLFYTDNLPVIVYPDGSPSAIWILVLLVTTIIILYASYLYARRLQQTGQENLLFLIYGFIILIFSNMVYFSYDTAGHLLKIAGFFYIHLAVYKSSVELPYEKLALAEEKLRNATEEKYRNLFDNAYDAIITLDLKDRITSWNRSAEKLFGWRAGEVIGQKFAPLMVPDDLRAERDGIVGNVMSGKMITGIETVRLHKDGHTIGVSATFSPLLDTNQNIIGLSGIIRERHPQK